MTALPALRVASRRWTIDLIDGPNMRHLGRRDRRLFGSIASLEELQRKVVGFGEALGVQVRVFASDYEGELLEAVHASAASSDGYLVDPGGLATVSEGLRHALQETRRPVVEVCFYNPHARAESSILTRSAIGCVTGFREYGYLAGLLGLVLSLDDTSFLHPDAPESPTVRRDGKPFGNA